MATVEELNFKLLVDDTGFNQRIKQITANAQKLNVELSRLLSVQARNHIVTAEEVKNAERLNQLLNERNKIETKANNRRKKKLDLEREITVELERQAKIGTLPQTINYTQNVDNSRTINNMRQAQAGYNAEVVRSSKLWRELKNITTAYFSVMGATRIISNLVQVSAEFELQRTTLAAILQDAEKAEQLYGQIKELAVLSPFSFKELATYAKQLSAYSIPVNELYETTKMLADVSAGLGVGMDRLVLAYGQIRSASFLRGQEVRQLTEAGISILEELRKQFVELGEEGISAADVFDKISARLVPFSMVEKVFKNMTSEGGKFYNMQEVQAETLKGKISNLTDAYQIMFSEIGDKHSSALKGAVDLLRLLAENYERIGRLLGELIVAYGTYRAALAATAVSDAILKYGSLAKAIESTTIAQKALNSVMLKNPLALLVALFGALAMSMKHTYDAAHKLGRELSSIADTKFLNAREDADNLERLAAELKNCTQGSQNYRDAISAINSQYGEYLPYILTEKQSYEQLKGAIDQATTALYAKARANAYEAGSRRIEEQYGEVITAYRQTFIEKLMKRGETQDSAKALVALYFEAIKDAAEGYDPSEIFNEVYRNFKGTGDDFFSGRENFWNNLKQGMPFIRNIFGVNDTGWQTARDALWNMTSATDAYNAALTNLSDTIEARFSGIGTLGFTNEAEMLDVKRISGYFDEEEKKIRANASLSREAVEEELNKLNIRKLEMLAKYYEDLSRPDKAQQFRAQADALQHVVTGWRAVANGFVDQTNSDLLANNYDYLEYVDMLRSEYKNVEKNAQDAANTANKMQKDFDAGVKGITKADVEKQRLFAEALANRKKIIENIGSALNVSIDDKIRKATTVDAGADAGASVKRIEDEISAYRELKRTYDEFRQYTSKENADKVMAQLFPGFASDAKYDEIIQALLASLKTLGTEGAQAAAKIEESLRSEKVKDALKEYQETAKREEEFQQRIAGYMEEAKTVQQKMADLKAQMASDLAAVAGDEGKAAAITAHYTVEIEKLAEELANLAQISLTDFWQQLSGDKGGYSYNSLERIRKQAIELQDVLKKINPNRNSEGKITGYTITKQNAGGLAGLLGITDDNGQISVTVAQVAQLAKIIDDINGRKSEKSGIRAVLDLIKEKGGLRAFVKGLKDGKDELLAIESAGEEIGKLGGMLTELGDALGSSALSSAGESFSLIGDVASNLASGDYFGAIGSIVSAVASWITAEYELRDAIHETAIEAEKQNVAAKLADGVSTIFGTNNRQAIENARALLSEYSKLTQVDLSKYTSNYRLKWGDFFGDYDQSLGYVVEKLGYSLYDAYGNLNAQALQAVLDTYKNLKRADKAWIEDAIKNSELYAQAMEQLDAELSNLYNQTLDNVADALVESWKSAGNAALDYADILDDVATSYAKMMIKEALIDNIFTPEIEDRIRTLSKEGNFESALSLLEQKLQEAAGMEQTWNTILSGISQYLGEGEESSDSLASGIKSITEDTANLLAGYVNAIRADVAYNRMQFETLNNDNKLILGLLPNAPTLAEYLTQIQANTYNTAENTGAMLSELRSMMTSETGATSLRVVM